MSESSYRGSLPVIFVTVFIDLLGFGMVLPLLPVYAKELAHSEQVLASGIPIGVLIGVLMSSFSAMQVLFSPVWGRLSDRIGRRPVLMIGLAGSVVFYAMLGLATVHRSFLWLLVSRVGAGIAGATIPTAHAYIADTTSPEARAQGMALVGTAFGLGFTFGPLLGLLALPRGGGELGPGPGYGAAMLSAAALALAYFRLPETLVRGAPTRRRSSFAPALDLLTSAGLLLLLAAAFLCAFAFSNFEATLSLLLKSPMFTFSFRQLCLTFALVAFVSAAVQGGLVGRLARYASERTLVVAGAVIQILGFGLLAAAAGSGSRNLLFVGLPVLVAGFALLTPSLNAMISRSSDPGRQGEIMGLTQGVGALARIVGPLVGIPLFFHAGNASPLWLGGAVMGVGLAVVAATKTGKHSTRGSMR